MRNRNGFTPLEILQPVPVRNLKSLTGFTLIELLVVITIMVVLAGLLIPGVLRAMKQAKTNRALSEMQHLATVITQVYSEIGYYVPLEHLTKVTASSADVRRWVWSDYLVNGQDDKAVIASANNLSTPAYPEANDVMSMWAGPYLTYKSYSTTTNRPLDPWGVMGNSNADARQYRMFWITDSGPAQIWVPLGAKGAMVIISAGGDGKYQCGITAGKTPEDAVQADFNVFNPALEKGDDVYYIFNAGIQ